MEIEEKLKKCENVMKKLYYNLDNKELQNEIETIFPNFKEYEDERIREELIKMFSEIKWSDSSFHSHNLTRDVIITWLKKQKKSEIPQWIIDFLEDYRRTIVISLNYEKRKEVDSKFLAIIDYLKGNSNIDQDNNEGTIDDIMQCIKHCDDHFIPSNGTSTSDMLAWLINHKDREKVITDRNRSDYQENDNIHIQKILSVLNVQVCWDGATGIKYNPYQAEIDWLISIQSKLNQGWTEKDKRMINILYLYLDQMYSSNMVDNKDVTKVKDWLKSLSPQNRWKPSDELDEASYQVGVKRVLENPESYGLTKYNWKPSDEQMEALEHFIVYHNGSTNYAKDLEELRLQLKKLREE